MMGLNGYPWKCGFICTEVAMNTRSRVATLRLVAKIDQGQKRLLSTNSNANRSVIAWARWILWGAAFSLLLPSYVAAAICDSNASPRTGKVGDKVTFSTAYDSCRGGEYGWLLTSPSGYTESVNAQSWSKSLNEPGTWQWSNVSHVTGCEQCSNDGTIIIDGAACGMTVIPKVPSEYYYPLKIPFRVEATLSGPGNCKNGQISYLWQFGNGQTSIYQNVDYVYGGKPGDVFSWSVTATGNGATNTASGKIKLTEQDCPLARLDGQECPFDISVKTLGGAPPTYQFSINEFQMDCAQGRKIPTGILVTGKLQPVSAIKWSSTITRLMMIT
jgi:hypothetical protein